MVEAQAAADPPWRVRPLVSLVWHEWPEGSVAFDEVSGQIVEFDPLAAAVMACIEAEPVGTSAIAEMLAADLTQPCDDEFRAVIVGIVEQFHRLGWVDSIIGA